MYFNIDKLKWIHIIMQHHVILTDTLFVNYKNRMFIEEQSLQVDKHAAVKCRKSTIKTWTENKCGRKIEKKSLCMKQTKYLHAMGKIILNSEV